MKSKKQWYYRLFMAIFTLLCMSGFAQREGNNFKVTPKLAEGVALGATKYYAATDEAKERLSELKVGRVSTYGEENNPYLYVVNLEPSGYVLVSGDLRVTPIIAYSQDGSFDVSTLSVPEAERQGINDWIDATISFIKTVQEKETEIPEVIRGEWTDYFGYNGPENPKNDYKQICCDAGYMPCDDLKCPFKDNPPGPTPCPSTIIDLKGPLLSTAWKQECNFNGMCPTAPNPKFLLTGITTLASTAILGFPGIPCGSDRCGRTRTGCFAVAAGQLAKYFGKPLSITKQPYDYSLMDDKIAGSETQKMLRDWGTAANAIYGCPLTAVTASNGKEALQKAGFSVKGYDDFDLKIIRNDILNATRPILLYGEDGNKLWTAHFWLCDGWEEKADCKGNVTYRIHLNWGHATTNGWYTVLSNSNYTFTEFNYPKPGSNSVFNNIKMLHTIQ
jgi:Spi protease inhibitor/Peptidase C10 family